MKTVKSYGKVTKPSFFDRVRNYSQKDLDQKKKFDINHIRQSNYKLERSKSHRNEHSLQRKAPIIAQQLKISKSKQNLQKRTLQTELSDDDKENAYKIKLDHCLRLNKENQSKENIQNVVEDIQNEHPFDKRKKGRKELNFSEILNLLKASVSKREAIDKRQQMKQASYLSLQQEEECLNLIKYVWQGINLMKSKIFLREQALKMQDLLKLQVLKLAKPKLSILQQNSTVNLKIFQSGPSSLQKMTSVKEQSDKSVSYFNFPSQQQPPSYEHSSTNFVLNSSESQSKEQLQYKKIMYILQENKKNKLASMIHQSIVEMTDQQGNEAEELAQSENQQIKSNKKKNHHLSSFNSMRTVTDRQVVYQQEKIKQSCSNDKMFLKNIVKKARKVDQFNSDQLLSNSFEKKSALDGLNIKAIASVQSEIFQSIAQELQDQFQEQKEQSKSQVSEDFNNGLSSKCSGNSKIMSEGESLKSEGESKRATLNNIVNMLNQRYNKQIRLQPPK